jgi:hypothetical protein
MNIGRFLIFVPLAFPSKRRQGQQKNKTTRHSIFHRKISLKLNAFKCMHEKVWAPYGPIASRTPPTP